MAIYRIRNGIVIRNMLLIEIQKFYEKEYFIGVIESSDSQQNNAVDSRSYDRYQNDLPS